MEPFELTAMRMAARTVNRWVATYGREAARQMVLADLAGIYGEMDPVMRAAYKTGFGL